MDGWMDGWVGGWDGREGGMGWMEGWMGGLGISSGVAKLGHTGARALATRGCAPPVQALLKIFGVECTVINCELGAKSAQRCWNQAAQYCYLYIQNNQVSYAPLTSMYACLL